MTKHLRLFLLGLLNFTLFSQTAYSQEDQNDKNFSIKVGGYVKYDMYHDSRQTIDAREGHLLLWPKYKEFDSEGKDINARNSFNFLAIQSRINLKLTGPDVFNAKTLGYIEGEFFGHSNSDINGFRLRHAYIKLDWHKSGLLMGQFWHPLFITDCFPGTLSFNTGLGFQPFSRNPQIKYTYKLGEIINLKFTIFSERDFPSRGMDGSASSSYVRNSGIPSLNFNLQYSNKEESLSNYITVGIAGNYKSMLPQLTTSADYITNQKINAFSAIAYINKRFKQIDVKMAATYGENTTDFFMLGGFATYDTLDYITKEVSYKPLRNIAAWIDISTTGSKWQFGVFGGYNKNIGASKDLSENVNEVKNHIYGYFNEISYLYRISPRIYYYIKNFQIGAELECSVAAYGNGEYNLKGRPVGVSEVVNYRILLGVYYHF